MFQILNSFRLDNIQDNRENQPWVWAKPIKRTPILLWTSHTERANSLDLLHKKLT
jgi:hypothetical protein